jgi:hypothetical protein
MLSIVAVDDFTKSVKKSVNPMKTSSSIIESYISSKDCLNLLDEASQLSSYIANYSSILPSEFKDISTLTSKVLQLSIKEISWLYYLTPATVCAKAVCSAFDNVPHLSPISSKILFIDFNSPVVSKMEIPTAYKAFEYLFNVTPSSCSSPCCKP